MSAHVDVDATCQPRTYIVRCPEHGDQTFATQWGLYRMTIFQGHNAGSDARRYAREHNAVQHPTPRPGQ